MKEYCRLQTSDFRQAIDLTKRHFFHFTLFRVKWIDIVKKGLSGALLAAPIKAKDASHINGQTYEHIKIISGAMFR